jgi:hypothetical protein
MSALPQEYGMIFILPCAYFIFEYFCHKKNAADKLRNIWLIDLGIAAMSFSMTIATHFYDTFVVGIFCIAIVVGFAVRFFRPKYLVPLMLAFLLGLFMGVLPMGIAAATGTQMQGSIGWGLSILNFGKKTTSETENETQTATQAPTVAMPDTDSEEISPSQENLLENADTDTSDITSETESAAVPSPTITKKTESLLQRIKSLAEEKFNKLTDAIKINVIRQYPKFFTALWLIGCAVLIVFGVFLCIFAHFYPTWYDYAFKLISIGVYILLLFAMFIPGDLGLPTLMDKNRSRIYMVYMITILYSMLVDIVSCILGSISKKTTLRNAVSFIITVSVCIAGVKLLGIRNPMYVSRNNILETNGAVTCLSRLLKEHKGKMNWTIVSANDETQMMNGHGYHYETITFLRYLKYADSQQRITIPTKYVYFFIEKRPLNYTVAYADSGQYISRDGAAKELPTSSGITPYKAESRWIVMSKMYYWAESFRKLFPFDMTVYYEDDEFICYELIQNESSLYNLLIDYNYNN